MSIPNLFSDWTLFLDRDGVINTLIPGDYVKHWDEFEFSIGTLENLPKLTHLFKYCIVVTNQQGIGKKLMTESSLVEIHQKMCKELEMHQGIINKVYYCPHLQELNCDCRKPKPGMLLQAKNDFAEVNFLKSILIGDSPSDIEMAKSMGSVAIAYLHEKNKNTFWSTTPDFFSTSFEDIHSRILPLLKSS